MKVLFIGNSHTYYNAMPLMVQSNANKAGYNCDVTRFTESAWALGDHMEDPDVSTAILEDGYDYVIGSVHSLKKGDRYYDVDHTEALLRELVDDFYGGDFIAMAEDYFANVARLADMKPHIIGHIDLITKFNEGDRLFNTRDPRYLAAAYRAVDALIPTGAAFEINTGAISRRRRTAPYPSDEIREYIRVRGGKLILCSDAHNAESIGYGFDAWQDYVTDPN